MLSGQSNVGNRIPTPNFAQDSATNILVKVFGNADYEGDLFVRQYDEYQTEQGDRYSVSGVVDKSTGEETLIQLYCAKQNHLELNVFGSLETAIYLFEGTSYDETNSDGTAVTPYNHNRGSANTSVTSVLLDPGIAASGTQIFATGVKGAYIPVIPRDKKIMVDCGAQYLFRFISNVDSNQIAYNITWTE